MTTTDTSRTPVPPSSAVTATGDGHIHPVDPRTMRPRPTWPIAGEDEVRDAVARARAAAPAWSALSFGERAAHLAGVRKLLLDRLDGVVDTIMAETGKLEAEAITTEILVTCELVDFYARKGGAALAPKRVSTSSMVHKRAEIRREPLGVVGVISPWNYPFTLAMAPVLTALFAGNTVVLKPSEVTPGVGVAVGELFSAAGAHTGIVQVVTGDGSTGGALVRSGVDKVAFTGSVATGRKVMAAAAETLTPVLLELGGKDPMIVAADADLDRAGPAAVWGAFQNSGQTCVSVERVYVADAIYDAFVERVVAEASAVRQGIGKGHDIGSMTFPRQIEIVERHVADAVDKGARVLVGGRRVAGREGLWFEPTVLVDVDHSMAVMTEETFGPLLPIMRVRDEEEALRWANATPYGLNASVFSRDAATAERLAAGLVSGSVCVNDCIVNYGVPALPFGGRRTSGFGRAHGVDGLLEMTATKSVLVDRGWVRREPQWFPIPSWLGSSARRIVHLRWQQGLLNKVKGALRG